MCRKCLKSNDALIIDRGFRELKGLFKDLGVTAKVPHFSQNKKSAYL